MSIQNDLYVLAKLLRVSKRVATPPCSYVWGVSKTIVNYIPKAVEATAESYRAEQEAKKIATQKKSIDDAERRFMERIKEQEIARQHRDHYYSFYHGSRGDRGYNPTLY